VLHVRPLSSLETGVCALLLPFSFTLTSLLRRNTRRRPHIVAFCVDAPSRHATLCTPSASLRTTVELPHSDDPHPSLTTGHSIQPNHYDDTVLSPSGDVGFCGIPVNSRQSARGPELLRVTKLHLALQIGACTTWLEADSAHLRLDADASSLSSFMVDAG
jgi:hypothetical protein